MSGIEARFPVGSLWQIHKKHVIVTVYSNKKPVWVISPTKLHYLDTFLILKHEDYRNGFLQAKILLNNNIYFIDINHSSDFYFKCLNSH